MRGEGARGGVGGVLGLEVVAVDRRLCDLLFIEFPALRILTVFV